jgi:hypothetical protein
MMGFYAQKKVGGILLRKEVQFGPRPGPMPDSRPNHPAADQTKPVLNKLVL